MRLLLLFYDVFVAGALSFGGLAAILSTLDNEVVERHQLMTQQVFNSSYAMAVAAPGPNAIFLSLLGYQVAGVSGALVASVAWGLPTITMLYFIGQTASSRTNPRITQARKALVPAVGGLLVAGTLMTSTAFDRVVPQWALLLVGFAALVAFPKMNPVWVVLGSAVVGAVFLT